MSSHTHTSAGCIGWAFVDATTFASKLEVDIVSQTEKNSYIGGQANRQASWWIAFGMSREMDAIMTIDENVTRIEAADSSVHERNTTDIPSRIDAEMSEIVEN